MAEYTALIAELGLSRQEAEVYVAGLRLGPCFARDIARTTRMNRSLVYHFVNSLEQRGLVSKTGTGYKKRFIMEPPARLVALADAKIASAQKLKAAIEHRIPEFESLSAKRKLPARVRFYEGAEGMKNILLETLEVKNKKIDVFVSIETFLQTFSRQLVNMIIEKRERRGIQTRSIWSHYDPAINLRKSPLWQLKIAPPGISLANTFFVFDYQVAILSSPPNLFGVVIESEEFADSMRSLFEDLWKRSSSK